jgi:hypothetical protein
MVNTAALDTVAHSGPSIYATARLRVREDEHRGARYDCYMPALHAPQAPPSVGALPRTLAEAEPARVYESVTA